MDSVVDLGERALKVPLKRRLACFFVFETLEFLDQVELELGTQPGAELKCNVFVCEGAAVATGFGI